MRTTPASVTRHRHRNHPQQPPLTAASRHLPRSRQELLLVSDDNANTDEVTSLYTLSVRF